MVSRYGLQLMTYDKGKSGLFGAIFQLIKFGFYNKWCKHLKSTSW